MRPVLVAAGFSVLAVGLVLGVVVSGFAPGAEAAPKQQERQTGRLVEAVISVPDEMATSLPAFKVCSR